MSDENPFSLQISGDVHYEATVRRYVAVPIEEGDEYRVWHESGDLIAYVVRDDTDPRTYRIFEPPMTDGDASGWRNSRNALNYALKTVLSGDDLDRARESIG